MRYNRREEKQLNWNDSTSPSPPQSPKPLLNMLLLHAFDVGSHIPLVKGVMAMLFPHKVEEVPEKADIGSRRNCT